MNRSLYAGAALTLCSGLLAQDYLTSPPGFLSTEGRSSRSSPLGPYQDSRIMLFDGELRGRSLSLKELGFRHESGYVHISHGRSWTNVTLSISNCDMSQLSKTFSANPTTSPATVFSSSITWPTVTGIPPISPAPWSMRFPFSTPWIYSGSQDICLDFGFVGGSMSNGKDWGYDSYYLDSHSVRSTYGEQTYHGKWGYFGGCVDSVFVFPIGASFSISATSQAGSNYESAHHLIRSWSGNTAPYRPVVHAMGLVGRAAGFALPGVTCNKLYLDPTQPFLLTMGTGDREGHSGSLHPTGTPGGYLTPAPWTAGLKLWGQAAWNDSRTGAVKLTNGIETEIPPIPRRARHDYLYSSYSSTATEGSGLRADSNSNAITRYGY